MRTRLTMTVLLVLIASLVLVAPSAANHKCEAGPLFVTETMTAGLPDHPDTWYGSLKGDINGTSESWGCTFDPGLGAMNPIILGGASPGYNVVTTRRGTITFYTMGIYFDGIWELRNVGLVTEATGAWRYLLGWVTYADGFSTDPSTWGDTYTYVGPRVFLPPSIAKGGHWDAQ
jgi:hypothetical protein